MNPETAVQQETGQLAPGLYPGISLADYLAIDALGSGRLEWLNISPLHYRYMLSQKEKETDALKRGSALHMAVLEPLLFHERYTVEPDPFLIAPGNVKPRATTAYKAAIAALEATGKIVLRDEMAQEVFAMAASIKAHPHAARLLEKAPEREITAIWQRNGHACRGRFDLMGDGALGDIKTTRSLRSFSPWTITKLGYYRQAGWYSDGASRLGRDVKCFFLVAVESVAPYDVGVFVLDKETLAVGRVECDALFRKLQLSEETGEWPGMFPEVQQATLTDAIALQLADVEVED